MPNKGKDIPGWRIAHGAWAHESEQDILHSCVVVNAECSWRGRQETKNKARKETGIRW